MHRQLHYPVLDRLACEKRRMQGSFSLGERMPDIATKRCNRCGCEYPETREFFGQFKNKRGGEVRIGFRGTCRICMSNHTKAYDAQNPDNVAARINRRRERSEDAGGSVPKDLPEVRRHLKDQCRYCSKDLEGRGHIDHLTPVARGGSNKSSNLTLCCEACNLAKTSKSFEEFLEWRRERKLPVRSIEVPGEMPDPVIRRELRQRF